MKNITFIVDMQFGSCGKGLLAGYIAKKINPDTIMTAWAPNAGHTFIDASGYKMVNCAIPNGIVANSVKTIMLGPGSVINPELLMSEIERYIGFDSLAPQIVIHPHAAVVWESHRQLEASYAFAIGSTMKGVGEAVMDKIRRHKGANSNVAKDALIGTPLEGYLVSVDQYNEIFDRAQEVLVEGAQGFSLGINNGFYPYTTSRECTVQQLMVDCAIPLGISEEGSIKVIGACRTYPIRVANRYDKDGTQIGTSGPCYDDQEETTFEAIGVPVEYTTVTNLPRRVFTFSMEQIRQAIRMNAVSEIFLNFANYMPTSKVADLIEEINSISPDTTAVTYIGWGPKEDNIQEVQ